MNNMHDILVNTQAVADCEDLSPVVRQLANTLLKNEYITVGSWLRSLSDSDIEYLSDVVEIRESDELYNEASEEVVLLTLLLIHAEGIYPETMHELSHHTGAFKMFVAGTSLARHGLAIAYYENMSFGDDVSDRVVFKKVD